MLCRFSLQHKQQLLGLPAGMCIKVKVGQQEQAFNPISTDETPGEVVILVKVRARHYLCPLQCVMYWLPSTPALVSMHLGNRTSLGMHSETDWMLLLCTR